MTKPPYFVASLFLFALLCAVLMILPIAAETHTHDYGDWELYRADAHQKKCECGDVVYAPHDYSGKWVSYDANRHREICVCGRIEYEFHTWDAGKVTIEPTKTTVGEKIHTCLDCGETKTMRIDRLQATSFFFGTCGAGESDVKWSIDTDSGLLKISGNGNMKSYASAKAIPWNLYQKFVQSVVIESGVTGIGAYAFTGCEALTSVTIADGVETLGAKLFSGCTALKQITIPGSVKQFGVGILADSGVTHIVLEEGIETIDFKSFQGCKTLTTITLPKSLKHIEGDAFAGCDALMDVHYVGTSEEWKAVLVDGGNDALTNCLRFSAQKKGCRAHIDASAVILLTALISTVSVLKKKKD